MRSGNQLSLFPETEIKPMFKPYKTLAQYNEQVKQAQAKENILYNRGIRTLELMVNNGYNPLK